MTSSKKELRGPPSERLRKSFGFETFPRTRLRTIRRVLILWNKVRDQVYSPRVLMGLPRWTEPIAKAFYAEQHQISDALAAGDVAFFASFLARLDQLDAAMVAAGKSEADRGVIVRARFAIDGFAIAAKQRLERLGGAWPPPGAP